MLYLIQVLTIVLAAIALAPALAHACEFPGKKQLNRDTYVVVQAIYYPGFTLLGASEPLALIATVALLFYTPQGTASFWLTLLASISLLCMQVIYWSRTHPTNKFWLQAAGTTLGGWGTGFFESGPGGPSTTWTDGDWRRLRDRWEYSHIARAAFAFVAFFSLVVASVIQK